MKSKVHFKPDPIFPPQNPSVDMSAKLNLFFLWIFFVELLEREIFREYSANRGEKPKEFSRNCVG